jgi:hypothetical protein
MIGQHTPQNYSCPVMERSTMADPIENIENIADALEKVDDAVDDADTIRPPGQKPKKDSFKSRIKAYSSLITHVVALLAAAGAFAKSCDHSVSKNVYNTLSDSITKVSDNQDKLARDVANIHGYLEGRDQRPLGSTTPSPSPSPYSSGSSSGSSSEMYLAAPPATATARPVHASAAKPVPSTAATALASSSAAMAAINAGIDSFSAKAAPASSVLLPASPPPAPVKPPPFAAVEAIK